MAVELVCPFCGFSKKTLEQTIPERARWAICPRCGRKFEILPPDRMAGPAARGMEPEDRPEGMGGETADGMGSERSGGPWEDRAEKGFLQAAWETFKRVVFTPGAFFQDLSFRGGLGEPLAFGLLMGAVGKMFSLFWPVLLISGGLFPLGGSILGQLTVGLIFLVLAVAVPICVMLSMFIYSGVLHLLLLATKGGPNGFEATFRVVAYSQAAQMWELMPVVGSWISRVWQVVIQVIGLRRIHGVSYARIIIAFLLPVAILAGVILAFMIPFIMMLFR